MNLAKIRGLKPDLIVANKEENEKSDIDSLRSDFEILLTDIYTYEDAIEAIIDIGSRVKSKEKAVQLAAQIEAAYASLELPDSAHAVLYLIWKEPLMAVGRKTFIHSMLQKAGYVNVIPGSDSRYPELTDQEIEKLNPEYIFLSSEPFPFNAVHQKSIQERFPLSKVVLVNGEMFSWYGSRMLPAAQYFKELKQSL